MPQSVDTPPTGDEWLHEVKLDGYRMLARIDGNNVRLVSRRGVDWTKKYSAVADALAALEVQAILDGEMNAPCRRWNNPVRKASRSAGEIRPACL